MPPPPLDVDEEMIDIATGEGHPQVQIPMGMRHRPYIRLRMELGDWLSTFLVEEGVFHAMVRDIKEDPTPLDLWRDLSHDMMSLMRRIVEVAKLLTGKRDGHSDTHTSSSTPSDDDQGGDPSATPPPPPSPHPYEQAPPIIPSLVSPRRVD